jgi:hypothetical protein
MAMEIHVFFRGRLPGKAALGRTMKELGFPLSLKPATGPLEGHSGYMPMRLRREETGVEFDIFEGRSMIDEFGLENVDPSLDRVGSFRWGGDEDEMLAALCGAAALAKLVNGIVLDEAGDRLLSSDQAIEMAKAHLNAAAQKQTKRLGSTRPADIKRYLKPLLELRPDLVLIDRMLIIRPIRHLLRGAFFDRTGDRDTFTIYRFFKPLYGNPRGTGYGDFIHGWAWHTTRCYFRPFLFDCLAEEILKSVGKMTTLAALAAELGAEELRTGKTFISQHVIALLLSGQKESAVEYIDGWEKRVNASREKERALLGRDIGDICAEFHAKEAETAKALKLGDMWEPAPFDVELPDSERGTRTADPLFIPEPWIPRPPWLLEEAPTRPGEMRFAKESFHRNGQVFLLVPLTREQAEERHRNNDNYAVAGRMNNGLLVVLNAGFQIHAVSNYVSGTCESMRVWDRRTGKMWWASNVNLDENKRRIWDNETATTGSR